MPQKQNLFPEDNNSKQTADLGTRAGKPFQKTRPDLFADGNRAAGSAALLMTSGRNNETIRYFDLVTDSSPAKPLRAGAAAANKKPAATAHQYFLPPVAAADQDDPQEFFSILLVYLDQIVYLREMTENLGKLDTAVRAGEIDAVNSIARNCIAAGTHCGMVTSVEMLRRLERITDQCQLAGAANLCRHIRREFEGFRRSLRENLEQMAAHKQNRSRN
jgi:hypothetical protein